ncbi:MAG: hypothetical protein HQM04_13205, partial [Magnetococcales bacterium]|nr:hypothetical protein [Magnetococcales bacterium]
MAESVSNSETGPQTGTEGGFQPSTEQQMAAELLDLSASRVSDGSDQSELIQSVRWETTEYSDLANLQPEVGVIEVSKGFQGTDAVLYSAVALVVDKLGSSDPVAPITNPDGREQIPVPLPPTEEPVFEPIAFGHDTSPIQYNDDRMPKTEEPELRGRDEESDTRSQSLYGVQSVTRAPSGQRPPSATTAPATTQPATTQPVTTEPVTTAPVTTEPTTTEPATTEPATTEPSTTEPATTEPATTEPATTEPATTEPSTAEPTTTEPATTEPSTTEPATTEPATTEPATTEPSTTEPTTTEP